MTKEKKSKMNPIIRKIIIVSVILLLLFITNPNEERFYDWTDQLIKQTAESEIQGYLSSTFAAPVLRLSTNRINLLFMSIYIVDMGNEKDILVGLVSNFVPIYISQLYDQKAIEKKERIIERKAAKQKRINERENN